MSSTSGNISTAVINMSIKQRLAYRSGLFFGILSTGISIVIYYFLWLAVFQDFQYIQNYTFEMMITYVILSRILSAQFSGGINGQMAEWIRNGTIATELLRPINFMRLLFLQRLGEFVQFIFIRALPVLIISALFLGMMPPYSPLAIALFLISILISIVMLFFVEFMVGLIAFYTLNHYGVLFAKNALLTLLSGGLLPITLFPGWLARFFELMPFQYMIFTPINVYLGILSANQALLAIFNQIIWTFILWLMAVLFYNRAIKKLTVQGG